MAKKDKKNERKDGREASLVQPMVDVMLGRLDSDATEEEEKTEEAQEQHEKAEDVQEQHGKAEDVQEQHGKAEEAETSEVKKNVRKVFEDLEREIRDSNLEESEKVKRLSRLLQMSREKVNILLVGATGSGKSSTINALFNMEVAKVGVGVDAETSEITKYELDHLTIWDTPGLGDGKKADKKYKNMLVKKLNELDGEKRPLIDIVIVVLDASSKDLGTSYDLINNVIIPCMGSEAEKRILVALNQADVAMKGRHWNAESNEPDEKLTEYLKEKAESVRKRIKEATGISIRPVYYCAGYKEEDGDQCSPYNLTKLLYYIVNSIPSEKRLALAGNLNPDEDAWLHDDEEIDYRTETTYCVFDMIGTDIEYYSSIGGEIGAEILGIPGRIVGTLGGAAVGLVAGIFDSVC